jgi:hypothetical protein
MNYKIKTITGSVATVEYSDGSWAELDINSTTTKSHFEQMVKDFAPKTDADVSVDWLTVGDKAIAEEAEAEQTEMAEWLMNRLTAYGSHSTQLEFITENGLDAWQTKVAQIKADNPKPE